MKRKIFKKLTSLILVFLMVVSMIPAIAITTGAAEEDQTYEKVDLADIKATDTIIIVSTKGTDTYAMSNDNGTSKAPAAVFVTVSNNTITTNATNILWNISNDNGNLTIYPAGSTETWLYCTSSNNGVRVGTNVNNVFTVDATSGYLKHTVTSRYLGVYNNQDWRCYTNTTGNTANQTFTFYKLKEACTHANTTAIGEYVAPGCTTTGMSAGEKCSNCNEVITEQEVIEAVGHIDADTNGYCDVCETLVCTNHNFSEGCIITPATCTEPGEAGVKCSVCGEISEDSRTVINPTGHDMVTDAPAVDATCTTPGSTAAEHCSNCDHVVEATEIPANGHNYEDGVCSVCSAPVPLDYIFDYTTGTDRAQMYGEQEGLVTLVYDKASGSTQPTWYSNGTALRFYTNNNLKISTVEGYYIKSVTLTITEGSISPDSGTLTSGVWTPADKETTDVIFTPSKTTRVQNISIELAAICYHTNKVAVGTPSDATCTEDGITAGEKCADCGEIITAQETIDALGHNFVSGTCTRCGESQCTEHVWKDGEVTTPATCSATGLQAQLCEVCGQPGEDKVLDKIAHTPETDEAVAPTCTATGLTEGSHCSVCEEVLTAQTVVDMVAHDYVDNKCTVCGDIFVAGTQLADFEFGTDGGSGEGNIAISTGVIETSNGYKLNFTTATNVYDKSWDAKGNAALKLGTSSKTGVFEFTVPTNVNTVVIYVAGRTTKNVGITVNDADYTITTHSDNGEYTKIVVDTTTTKTVNLTTTTNYRAYIDSIEFWGDTPEVETIGSKTGNVRYYNETTGKYVLYLFCGIDSLNYREVGFIVTVGDTTKTLTTQNVYGTVNVTMNGNSKTLSAAEFSQEGYETVRIFAQGINFKEDYKDSAVTFKPYAVKMDGTTIYGNEAIIETVAPDTTVTPEQ